MKTFILVALLSLVLSVRKTSPLAFLKSQVEFKNRRHGGIKVSFRFKTDDKADNKALSGGEQKNSGLSKILEQQQKVETQLNMRMKQ